MLSRGPLVFGALFSCSNCGGQVGFDSTEGNQATGGSSSSSTQTANSISSGGTSPSTGETAGAGGASTVDMAYCDGLLIGMNCGYFHAAVAGGDITCAVPLQPSPVDAYRDVLAIDCERIPFVGLGPYDGGTANGYLIDYTTEPATLILVGSACDALQEPGNHTLDFVFVCPIDN